MKVPYINLGWESQTGSHSEMVPFVTVFGSFNGSKRFEFFQNGVIKYAVMVILFSLSNTLDLTLKCMIYC